MSKPNWNRQAGLALTLVVLASVVYWSEFSRKPKKEDEEELNKKIFALKGVTIKTIQLSDGNGKELSLNCLDQALNLCRPGDTSKWEVTSPVRVKADDANVSSLVSALNNLNASDTISLKDETPEKKLALLKEYGLDPALITAHKNREAEVQAKEGNITLYLGSQHPIGDGIFAVVEKASAGQAPTGKIDDNNVFVLPNYIKGSLEHDLTYWRDKKLLTVSTHEIASFDLKGTKAEIKGTRNKTGWVLSSKGDEVTGDIESVDNFLTGATYLVAKDFAADNKNDAKGRAVLKGANKIITLSMTADPGLVATKTSASPSPKPSVSATPSATEAAKPSEPVVLTVYAKPGKKVNNIVTVTLFATVSNTDPVYQVENYTKDRLDKELKDLRLGKLINSMDRFGTKKILAESKTLGKPISLQMKDGKWAEMDGATPTTQTIDGEKVQNMLDRLESSPVRQFIPLSKTLDKNAKDALAAASQDSLTITLGDDSNADKRKLEFWKFGGKVYARDLHSDRKEIFVMDDFLGRALPFDRAQFQKTTAKK